MLISELIHRLTSISRKHGDLEVTLNDAKEIVEAKMMLDTQTNKKLAVILELTEMKDQLA